MVLIIFLEVTFYSVLSLHSNKSIFSIYILIIIIQLCLFFDSPITSGYYCPRCQSDNVIEYDNFIECVDCELIFSNKSILSDVDDDNILGEEELLGVSNSFSDEEREEIRKIHGDDDINSNK